MMHKLLLIVLAFSLSTCVVKHQNNSVNRALASTSNFDFRQTKLVMSADSSQAMKLWLVTDKQEKKLLRQQAEDIIYSSEDKVLPHFINRLYKTVIDSVNAGVGIAAPQVGISKNIIWVQRFDKLDYPFEVYLNPVITYYSEEKQPCREGCLSIPGRSDKLKVRSQEIKIEYLNKEGVSNSESVSGFTAVIFQHEIDHLNGVLYTDYLESDEKTNE